MICRAQGTCSTCFPSTGRRPKNGLRRGIKIQAWVAVRVCRVMKNFLSIRQRELQAWQHIMCSLCAAASLLTFSERKAREKGLDSHRSFAHLSWRHKKRAKNALGFFPGLSTQRNCCWPKEISEYKYRWCTESIKKLKPEAISSCLHQTFVFRRLIWKHRIRATSRLF